MLGKNQLRAGPSIRDVSGDEKDSVEKEKITAAHRTTGPQLAEKASHRRVLIMIVAA